MPGRHPPTIIIPSASQGPPLALTDGNTTSRTMRPHRLSMTGRNAAGGAFRDIWTPLHDRDRVAPAILPDEKQVWSIIYTYDHVKNVYFRERMDRARERPRIVWELIEWGQRRGAAWTANGTSSELYIYHVMAKDRWEELTPGTLPGNAPGGISAKQGEWDPTLFVADVETVLTAVDQVTWDAGSPPPGEAWRLIGGQRIRLGTLPAIRTVIELRYLPVYRMVEDVGQDAPRSTRSARSPGFEPRVFALVEAQP